MFTWNFLSNFSSVRKKFQVSMTDRPALDTKCIFYFLLTTRSRALCYKLHK